MNIPPALLTAFPPSGSLLLDVARRDVDDSMLEEIARADYGIDAALHVAALRPIRDTGVLPASMGWHPGEVLELIRWSDPENSTHKPGATGRCGHQMRAFVCAALLRADAEGSLDIGAEATLAQCLSSATALGEEMSEAAASFLTWRIPTMANTERWLFSLGLLIVAMRFLGNAVNEHTLGEAVAWFLDEEGDWNRKFRLRYNPSDPPPDPIGLTYGRWKPLIAELLGGTTRVQTEAVRADLEMFGELLIK